jgi:hypothetical protein
MIRRFDTLVSLFLFVLPASSHAVDDHPFDVSLERCSPRQFILGNEGTLELRGSVLQRIALQLEGKVSTDATTVDGRPFP